VVGRTVLTAVTAGDTLDPDLVLLAATSEMTAVTTAEEVNAATDGTSAVTTREGKIAVIVSKAMTIVTTADATLAPTSEDRALGLMLHPNEVTTTRRSELSNC
jgi:hypothetical protein